MNETDENLEHAPAHKQKRVWAGPEMRALQAEERTRNREIGGLLERARTMAGHTQRDCAAAAGVSRGHYQGIERGTSSMSVAQLERLLTFLDLPIDEILRPLAGKPLPTHSSSQEISLRAGIGQPISVVINVLVDPLPSSDPA